MTARRSGDIPVSLGVPLETGAGYHVRALQVDGAVDGALDGDRLAAAVRTVAAATPFPGFAPDLRRHRTPEPPPADPAAACVARLLDELHRPADRDGGSPARFHWVPLAGTRGVLGLVAPQRALDARSLYAALGAVLLAYFGRFRAAAYRDPAELAGFDPVGTPAADRARRRWWSAEFPRYAATFPRDAATFPRYAATAGGLPTDHRRVGTKRLRVDARRWAALTGSGGPLGTNGSLAVVALLAWCLRAQGRPGGSGFCCEFDLRDYFRLGQVLGPLTDRLAFRVDVEDARNPTFAEVMRRTQAGFLDSVVREVMAGH